METNKIRIDKSLELQLSNLKKRMEEILGFSIPNTKVQNYLNIMIQESGLLQNLELEKIRTKRNLELKIKIK